MAEPARSEEHDIPESIGSVLRVTMREGEMSLPRWLLSGPGYRSVALQPSRDVRAKTLGGAGPAIFR
jgi:hypothetical protein